MSDSTPPPDSDFGARLNGVPVARWQAAPVAAGSLLEFGSAQGAGCRAYLAISGGIEVPEYLGSKSTFILGRFGGHGGRVLRAGDVLHLGEASGKTGQEACPTEIFIVTSLRRLALLRWPPRCRRLESLRLGRIGGRGLCLLRFV